MTELEQKIIERVKADIHLLWYWDKVNFRKILNRPEGAELTTDDQQLLQHLGKAFGLVPKTLQEQEQDRRDRMKRHPGPGPLKKSSRRRRF